MRVVHVQKCSSSHLVVELTLEFSFGNTTPAINKNNAKLTTATESIYSTFRYAFGDYLEDMFNSWQHPHYQIYYFLVG